MAFNCASTSIGISAFWFSASIGTYHYWNWHSLLVPVLVLAFLHLGSVPVLAHMTGSHPSWISLQHSGFFSGTFLQARRLVPIFYSKSLPVGVRPKISLRLDYNKNSYCPTHVPTYFLGETYQKPWVLSAPTSAAAGGPPAPIQAQHAWLPHHWQCPVRFFGGEI
jgi:hypothetical protein